MLVHHRGRTRLTMLLSLCMLLVMSAVPATADVGGDSALTAPPDVAEADSPPRSYEDVEDAAVSPRMDGAGSYMLPDEVVTDERGREYTLQRGVVVTELSEDEIESDPNLTLEAEGPQAQAASGCNDTWYFAQLVYAGQIAWRLSVDVSWCYNGSVVTSHSPGQITPQVYGWAAVLGYAYTGTQQNDTWDYFGDGWVYRTFVVGGFERCTGPWGCTGDWTATVRIDRYGDGTWRVANSVL